MQTSDTERTAAFDQKKERFSAFLRNTDQKEVQLKATIAGLQEHAPTAWQKAIDANQEFCIYFVGAGNGGLELPLAQSIIQSRGTKNGLSIVCEDVSAPMKEEFLHTAAMTGLAEIVKEYVIAPFESPSYQPHRADFSASSHVWYYVQQWKNTPRETNSLIKFQQTIREDGVGLITLYSQKSDRYMLLQHVHSLQGLPEPELPGEEVVKELEMLSVRNATNIVDAHTNIASCFQQDKFDPTDEGVLLLSFILRTDWSELSEEVQTSIGKELAKIVEINGKPEMMFRDVYIWIFP